MTDELNNSYDNTLSGLLGTNIPEVDEELLNTMRTLSSPNRSINNDNDEDSVRLTKENFGLGNVDNTSDLDKPISTATQEALNDKVTAVEGMGLSTNDYTDADKTKLSNIEDEANKTIVDSSLSNSSENPVQNKVLNGIIGGIDSTGNDYIQFKSGIKVYFTNTAPTGTIPDGSIGVGW
jgi:hypothetical protein